MQSVTAIAEIGPNADYRPALGKRIPDFPSGSIVDLRAVERGHHGVALLYCSAVHLHYLLRRFCAPCFDFLLGEKIARPAHVMSVGRKLTLEIPMPADFGRSVFLQQLVIS